MIDTIHHINFLVRDLGAAVARWSLVLDREPDRYDELPGRSVSIAQFRIGETWLALVQPTGAGAPAAYLEQHGEGFFLLSLHVPSLDEAVTRVGEAFMDGPERTGIDGWRIRDLKAEDTFGALVQFCEHQKTE